MIDTAALIALILFPFLAGNICSILNRQPKLSIIGRPLARTTLLFCLGVWFLNLPSEDPSHFAVRLVPWILIAHLMISFIPHDKQADARGLRFDALLYSASFLSAVCLTRNLVFLMLFGESLAVSTWLTSTAENRRRIVKRTLATFALIVAGTGLILSHTGTAEFSQLARERVSANDHRGRFAEPASATSLAMRGGLLFLVVGLAWRAGFFPFESLSASSHTLGGFQRQLSLAVAAVLIPAILLPKLPGYEYIGLMLLFTLAVPTLVREVWRSRRRDSASDLWSCWWKASAALMWISLGLALYSLRQGLPHGLWMPAGLEAVRLELLSSLGAFIVLTAVTQAFSISGRPLQTRETLAGLVWSAPFYSTVMVLGVMSWLGFPFLAGFAPRWGVIASLLEVAGTEVEGSNYFFLIAVVVLCCETGIAFLGLLVVQSLCDPSPATRPAGETHVWKVWPFAVLLFAIIMAEWM